MLSIGKCSRLCLVARTSVDVELLSCKSLSVRPATVVCRQKHHGRQFKQKLARKIASLHEKEWKAPSRGRKNPGVVIQPLNTAKSKTPGLVNILGTILSSDHLRQLAAELRTDVTYLLNSGKVHIGLTGIKITKAELAADSSCFTLHWTPHGGMTDVTEQCINDNLEVLQMELQSLHPRARLPQLIFTLDVTESDNVTSALERLELGSSETDEDFSGFQPPPIVLVRDVYGLNHQVLMDKLGQSNSDSVTQYGARDRTDEPIHNPPINFNPFNRRKKSTNSEFKKPGQSS